MPSRVGFTYKDYSDETASVGFDITTMTAANFDATITAVNALSAAILAVQVENSLQSKRVFAQDAFISRAKAATKPCQRENKWLVSLEDATLHTISRHEIPQADLTLVMTDSEYLDLSEGVGETLKTTIEAIVKSPAGNAVNVLSVQFVGKRL